MLRLSYHFLEAIFLMGKPQKDLKISSEFQERNLVILLSIKQIPLLLLTCLPSPVPHYQTRFPDRPFSSLIPRGPGEGLPVNFGVNFHCLTQRVIKHAAPSQNRSLMSKTPHTLWEGYSLNQSLLLTELKVTHSLCHQVLLGYQ